MSNRYAVAPDGSLKASLMAEVKRESRPQRIEGLPASVNFNNPDSSTPVRLRCTIAKRRESRSQKTKYRSQKKRKSKAALRLIPSDF
jgi:hypothetical protein